MISRFARWQAGKEKDRICHSSLPHTLRQRVLFHRLDLIYTSYVSAATSRNSSALLFLPPAANQKSVSSKTDGSPPVLLDTLFLSLLWGAFNKTPEELLPTTHIQGGRKSFVHHVMLLWGIKEKFSGCPGCSGAARSRYATRASRQLPVKSPGANSRSEARAGHAGRLQYLQLPGRSRLRPETTLL